MKMLKHMRILAVAFLAAMIFAGCGESKSSSGKSADKSSSSSSGKKSKKITRKLDPKKLAEGKKAIEEDKKRGIEFEENKNGIVLVRFPKDSNIKSYKIPYGVTEIGEEAFTNCKNLTSVTIPDSVTEICYDAFSDCTNLTSITIPDSVIKIGGLAFEDCDNLTSITIPDSIESMPSDAFDNIKNVIAAQKNPNFYFDDRGVLFNKKTKALLGAPNDLTGSYVIPNSVTKIGNGAFYYTNLTSITIPNSVTEIGEEAFRGCEKLTSITIPNSVTEIGEKAFENCKNLTSITLPAKFKGKEKDLNIPENCKVTYR